MLPVIAFILAGARPDAAFAQVTNRPPAQVPVGDSAMVADTIPKEDHTARNAFARALVLPGWGHFGIGANRRGMVFVALQGSSWFMLTKTIVKLNRATDRNEGFEAAARDSLTTLMAA